MYTLYIQNLNFSSFDFFEVSSSSANSKYLDRMRKLCAQSETPIQLTLTIMTQCLTRFLISVQMTQTIITQPVIETD